MPKIAQNLKKVHEKLQIGLVMNILILKENGIAPHLGGIARISYDLMNALCERGFSTYLLSWNKDCKIVYDNRHYFFPNSSNFFSDENLLYLMDFCNSHSIDIIINQCFSSSIINFLYNVKTNCNVRIVSVIHNNFVQYSETFIFRREWSLRNRQLSYIYYLFKAKPFLLLYRQIARLKYHKTAKDLYSYSDKIVLVSKGNISEFLFLLYNKDPLKKLVSIENFTTPVEDNFSLDYKKENVVWCGTVSYGVKKADWILEIWKFIEAKSTKWNLYILGDSPSIKDLKAYSNKLQLKRVSFEGRVNPDTYYKNASILCSTSVSESFGLVFIEAMKYKIVPVSFASSPAIKDIISDVGVLIKPFDKKEYAIQLLNLMNHREQRNGLAEKCYIRSKLYFKDAIIDKWISLFNSFVNN